MRISETEIRDYDHYFRVQQRIVRSRYEVLDKNSYGVVGRTCAPQVNCLLCELYKGAALEVARTGRLSDYYNVAIKDESSKDIYEHANPNEILLKCPRIFADKFVPLDRRLCCDDPANCNHPKQDGYIVT